MEKSYLDVDSDKFYDGHEKKKISEEKDDSDGKDNIHRLWDRAIAEENKEDEGEDMGDDVSITPLSPPSSSPSSPSSTSSSLLPLPPPTSAVHLVPHTSKYGLASHVYIASREEAGIERTAVWGINSSARNNLIWQPDTGEVMVSCDVR